MAILITSTVLIWVAFNLFIAKQPDFEQPSVFLIIMAVFAYFLIFKVGLTWIKGKSLKEERGKHVYLGLRNQALSFTPEMLGNVQTLGTHGVYGVLMEMACPEGVITLVTFVTGDASLYFGNGGGVIGGVGYDVVKKAAVDLNNKADQFVPSCIKTSFFPSPSLGQTIFYILTTEGVVDGHL